MSRLISAASLGETRTVTLGALAGATGGSPFLARFADGQKLERPRAPQPAPPVPEVPAVDPVEQARAEAFAQGFDEGMRVASEGMVSDEEAKARLAEALEQIAPAAQGALPALLSAAVLRLVEQIVGQVPVDRDLLMKRVNAVAAFVDAEQERRSLYMHPEDIALLSAHEFGFALTPDPAMTRGSVRLDTGEGWIEDGPDVQLSRLKAMLDTMDDGQGEAGRL